MVQVGEKVAGFVAGDRVTVEPVIACGSCYYCQRGEYHLCANISFQYRKGQGAFSEYFYAPENRTYKLLEGVSFEEGALIEPLSVALHAVKKCGIGIGQSSAVIGTGAIGQLTAMLLNNLTGIKPFVADINEFAFRRPFNSAHMVFLWVGVRLKEIIMSHTDRLGVDSRLKQLVWILHWYRLWK